VTDNAKEKPMNAEELRIEIEHRIMAKPETGEQWAEICALEAAMVAVEPAFCACGNEMTSDKEQRDGVCRECL
jgi:hypothetical protein